MGDLKSPTWQHVHILVCVWKTPGMKKHIPGSQKESVLCPSSKITYFLNITNLRLLLTTKAFQRERQKKWTTTLNA